MPRTNVPTASLLALMRHLFRKDLVKSTPTETIQRSKNQIAPSTMIQVFPERMLPTIPTKNGITAKTFKCFSNCGQTLCKDMN